MISFEEHVELCRYFQFERLKQLVSEEPDDIQRDVLLTSTFFILDSEVKADYLDTLKWGEYYLDYLASHPNLPPEQSKPRSDIMRIVTCLTARYGFATWLISTAYKKMEHDRDFWADGSVLKRDGRPSKPMRPNKSLERTAGRCEVHV